MPAPCAPGVSFPACSTGDADNILIGGACVFINNIDVGFTKGGTTFRLEPEFIEVQADQVGGIVRKARSNERAFVTTTLLEVSLEQMRLSFMYPSGNISGATLTLGYSNPCFIDEVAICLVGPGPGSPNVCGTRRFDFPKAVTFGTREYNMQRDEETAYEVEFEIIKAADGTFGKVWDE